MCTLKNPLEREPGEFASTTQFFNVTLGQEIVGKGEDGLREKSPRPSGLSCHYH